MSEYIPKLSSKSWSERKQALDQIDARLRSVSCSKIEAADLVFAVINVLSTDTHLQLVTAAANTISRAANSLGQDFASLSKPALVACLTGFRKGKHSVLSALRSAADSTLNTLSLEAVVDAILVCLADKATNPNAKEEAVSLLGRAFLSARQEGLPTRRNFFKRVLTPLLPLTEARTDGLRDATYNAIAAARVFLADDAAYARFTLEVLDKSKSARVEQALGRINSDKAARESSVQTGIDPTAWMPVDKTVMKRDPPEPIEQDFTHPHPTKKSKTTLKTAISTQPTGPFASEQYMPENEVNRLLNLASFSENAISQLNSSNWRERLASLEGFSAILPKLDLASPAIFQSIIRLLLTAPGFKESNVQVRCQLLDVIGAIMASARPPIICESLFHTLTSNLSVLIGTSKNVASCESCLSGLERVTGLELVGQAILRLAASAKQPKSNENLILWLTHAVERSGFCLNGAQVTNHLKDGFHSAAHSVRLAYIKLAGAVYAALGSANSAFRADLESSTKPVIAALLRAEFQSQDEKRLVYEDLCDEAMSQKPQTLALGVKRTAGEIPFSPPVPSNQKRMASRRTTTILTSPSEGVQRSFRCAGNAISEDASFRSDEQSPMGLSSTFCAVTVPLLMADFKAKQTRLARLSAELVRPSRENLERDFTDAGMHHNLRRLLVCWDSDPDKTIEALVLLTHILLQQTPSRHKADRHHQHADLLTDTLANCDLIFQWMVVSCFTSECLRPEVLTQALDYLEEFVARLADAKLTLTPCEINILLPWPLCSSPFLKQCFGPSSGQSRRLSSLLLAFCRVVSPDLVYSAVMEAVSTVIEVHIIRELLLLVKLLLKRYPSLPIPSVADIKAIAQHVGSPDVDVNLTALECLKVAQGSFTVEQISSMAGKLTDRDRTCLVEALNQDSLTQNSTTPLRPKTPIFEGGREALSYTNNPSILASVSRSHLAHRSRLATCSDEDEHPIRAARQWILDVLSLDDRGKESRMVHFLVSQLITKPVLDGVDCLDRALMAMSHMDFLHHSTATRDLLLPEACTLVEYLGRQMTCIALGGILAFDYTSEEADRVVRSCTCFAITIFRASFLTRDLTAQSLSHLLLGLLRLHTTFDLISHGRFNDLPINGSILSLLLDLGRARPLEDHLLRTLIFIHNQLMKTNLSTYIISLSNLVDVHWSGYSGSEEEAKEGLLSHSYLHLQFLDLASKKMAQLKGDLHLCAGETFDDADGGRLEEVIKALGKLQPFEPQGNFNGGLLIAALAWNRLRR